MKIFLTIYRDKNFHRLIFRQMNYKVLTAFRSELF